MQPIFNNKAKDDYDNSNSLAHTKWNCKYHIVFAPKYRRKIFMDKREKK